MANMTLVEVEALVTALLHVAAASAVTLHVLGRNLEVRAAVGWIGISWLSPFLGSAAYYLFGINRVTRRAVRRRRRSPVREALPLGEGSAISRSAAEHYRPLAILIERVTREPVAAGNRLEPLENGDAAYPAMIAAIDAAKKSVALSTYIFRADAAGRPFIDALARAHRRGVAVRVLLDGVGGGYFRSPARRELERQGVRVAQFFHTWVPWHMPYVNMRLHKKLLILDGTIGFAGGMNIGGENLSAPNRRAKHIRDLHFRIAGPVVSHLFSSFAEDWRLETGETLNEEKWCVPAAPVGNVLARGIASGPDEDLMKLEAIILAAVGAARQRVRIVTPYFLPERIMLMALLLALLRGVRVQIVLPARSNHPPMDWAAWAQHKSLVERGCEIHLTPPPFDHTKLMTLDGMWTMFGSSNWDARSLRLNFEYNITALDPDFTTEMDGLIDRKIATAQPVTLEMINARSPPARLRDAAARLFLPYL